MGTPATAAFWTSSKRHAARDEDDPVVERQPPRQHLAADELVERVVAADILAQLEELAIGGEQPGRVEPPGRLEHRLGRAQTVRQRQDHLARHHRPRRQRVTADRDLVERCLAADPARRRRDEVPLRDERRVERARQAHQHLVIGLGGARRVPERDIHHLGAVDQPFRAQEPDRQLRLVAGRAHRDRDLDGLLPRAGRADRHRLLAHQPVRASLDGRPPNRHDLDTRGASLGTVVDTHGAAVYPGIMSGPWTERP